MDNNEPSFNQYGVRYHLEDLTTEEEYYCLTLEEVAKILKISKSKVTRDLFTNISSRVINNILITRETNNPKLYKNNPNGYDFISMIEIKETKKEQPSEFLPSNEIAVKNDIIEEKHKISIVYPISVISVIINIILVLYILFI